ncbi:MAG: LPS export ABC transporter permease LptF [Burkholderiaceae bacterium]|nr:LPS export ABC transporter permease LptF [Burkholderiaceae bacterium]
MHPPLAMLFKKSLRRDMANLAGVVFATLFTIMVTTTLIRTLGRAASGRVDTASILPLIAFSAINFLPVLLVLTLYIAILMALTRAYRDSEMVIWFASGRSLLHFVRPVLSFAVPFVLLVAGLSFSVAPWANRQIAEYQQRFEQRQDVSQVSAGQFRESASASRVFFVESISEDEKSVRNVFVTHQRGDELTIVVSVGGEIIDEANGDRFLVLEKGRRYDGAKAAPEFRVMEFERYGLRIDPALPVARDESSKAKATGDLIRDPTPRHLGELLWRIGLPLSAIALALLAIPLSSFNPRVGRSINLIIALLVYVTYSNLLSLSQAWVVQGRLPFEVGVWLIHVILLAVAAVMFWRRVSLARWRVPLWRRSAAS